MTDNKWLVVEEETYDKAVAKALGLLRVRKSEMDIEVISEPKPGLFGFGNKSAVIKVRAKQSLAALVDDILTENSATDILPGGEQRCQTSKVVPIEVIDGYGIIKDSQVIITDPEGGGRFPILIPDPNARVTVNGQRIDEPTVVSSADTILVEAVNYQPHQSVEIEISPDNVTAYLKIQRVAGRECDIRDSQPVQEIKVLTQIVRTTPPQPVSEVELEDIVKKSGIIFGLDMTGIDQAIKDLESSCTKVIIARGKAPIYAKPGEINIKFNQQIEKNVNPYGEGVVKSVLAGSILAIKEPTVFGEEGIDVFGKKIIPRKVLEIELKAKDGTQIIHDGTMAVAIAEGRPVVEGKYKNIFGVVPIHTVQGDVDISVGNLKFNGDIEIYGNVMDGFRVEASGDIIVHGNVIRAELLAGGNVVVKNNIISSTVKAGGQTLIFKFAIPMLKEGKNKLIKLQETVLQLKKHPSFSQTDLHDGDGRLIQLLVESRFPVLGIIAAKLKSFADGNDINHDYFCKVVNNVYYKISGLGPLRIKDVGELAEIAESIDLLVADLEDMLSTNSAINTAYVQNSSLQASGNIVISGAGSIISDLTAGQDILIHGSSEVVRGGRLTAYGLIKIKELGSSSAEATVTVQLIGKGRLEADIVHPIVIIEYGAQKYRFETWPARYVEAYADKDEKLVINKLKGSGGDR